MIYLFAPLNDHPIKVLMRLNPKQLARIVKLDDLLKNIKENFS